MTGFVVLENRDFENLICEFDASVYYLKQQINFNIELKSYGNMLRIAINNIQPESFNNLRERISFNRELERALDNAGGYTIDSLGTHNPKTSLMNLAIYLTTNPLKLNALSEFIKNSREKITIIADTNDIDYLSHLFRNNRINIISFSVFKRKVHEIDKLVFYSFNGKKDFDFVYNLQSNVTLILYPIEHQLYLNQLQNRKQLIEDEVGGNDRYLISSIHYEPIPDLPVHLSDTIQNIVNRIDNLGNKAYENYKEESDILLEDIEDKLLYRTRFSNNKVEYLESIETVFAINGDLIKVYNVKVEDSIRLYPREQFGEKLYQVAVDTDKEIFGKVEEHSKYWLEVFSENRDKYKNDLYAKLKEQGIRVLPGTVDSYSSGKRKFPMYNSDLKAIFRLKYIDKSDEELDVILAPIRKSKSTYNSTMIALGRGIKQEIKLFLKEKIIGEILARLNFNATTLYAFIEEYMPLMTVVEKEIYDEKAGNLELFNINQYN